MAGSVASYLWKKSVTTLDKGGEIISTVGSAVQSKFEDTGIPQGVAHYTNQAAEGTMHLGSSILEKGGNTVEAVAQNEYVDYTTTKSKEVLGAVGGAVAGVSSVRK